MSRLGRRMSRVIDCVMMTMVMIRMGAAEHAEQAAASEQEFGEEYEYKLVLIDQVKYPRARCLDGSPPGFYISNSNALSSSSSSSSAYVLHFQGGGWCAEDKSLASNAVSDLCSDRANGKNPFGDPQSLGGSALWPPYGCTGNYSNASVCTADSGNHGILSSSSEINPLLFDAVHVYISYCSGDSFAGSRDSAYVSPFTQQRLYFRGLDNRRAVVNELLQNHGMNQASMVVVTGSSAGGLAFFLAADDISDQIHQVNPKTLVLSLPDAGFFLDMPSYSHNDYTRARGLYSWLFSAAHLNQTNQGIPSACLSHFPPAQQFLCLFPQYLLATTVQQAASYPPTFVVNSLIDAAQAQLFMDLQCSPNEFNCDAAQIEYLHVFHATMIGVLTPLLALPNTGTFLIECFIHIMADADYNYVNLTIQSISLRDAIVAWIQQQKQFWNEQQASFETKQQDHEGKGGSVVKLIDTTFWSATTGGNPTCAPTNHLLYRYTTHV